MLHPIMPVLPSTQSTGATFIQLLPSQAPLFPYIHTTLAPAVQLHDTQDAVTRCAFEEPSLVLCTLQGGLTAMQKLCLVRILKQESVGVAGQQYVAEQLGPQFVSPKPAALTAVWKESDNTTPIIFILSSGCRLLCKQDAQSTLKKKNLHL